MHAVQAPLRRALGPADHDLAPAQAAANLGIERRVPVAGWSSDANGDLGKTGLRKTDLRKAHLGKTDLRKSDFGKTQIGEPDLGTYGFRAIGHRGIICPGHRAVRAWQPQPARLCSRPLTTTVRNYPNSAPAQPSVPRADPGPCLTRDTQPDLRAFPCTRHEQHATVATDSGLKPAASLCRRPVRWPQQDQVTAVKQGGDDLRPVRAEIGDQ